MVLNQKYSPLDTIKKIIPVVGVGASPGGLEAITLFVASIQPGSGLAYVYLQHTSPDYKSLLPELLAKKSTIIVPDAEHKIKVEPDHFYIVPPNKTIDSTDGYFQLSPRKHLSFPINESFYNIFNRFKDQSIGVVLSGSLKIGTYGLNPIKNNIYFPDIQ